MLDTKTDTYQVRNFKTTSTATSYFGFTNAKKDGKRKITGPTFKTLMIWFVSFHPYFFVFTRNSFYILLSLCLFSIIHIYYPYIIEMGSCVSPVGHATEKIKGIKASKCKNGIIQFQQHNSPYFNSCMKI